MFFPVRNALIYALVSAITGFATGFAKANVLDEMPNTQACRTLKNDIMPHVESRQNRDDLDFLMVGTYRQGKDGEQCRIFKGDRDRIKNSRDLNLSGISLYARERVFAWGRSCLLDWCEAAPGTPQSQVPSSTPPEPDRDDTPSVPPSQTPSPGGTRDHGTYTLKMCNYTRIAILYVAVALYDDPNDDLTTVRAWFPIPKNQCVDWRRRLGKYATHNIAYRVEGDVVQGGVVNRTVIASQGETTRFCVIDAHTYGYVRSNTANYQCRQGERLEDFWKYQVREGVNTINFNVPR